MNKNPDGLEDSKIADILCISVEEVESLYQSAIKKIRQKLNIKV
jgi:DNA-directed RNA polymerase specialized sigma24 family protein